jgi:glycosyltransferase involved in cell wall biosynthesis
LINQIKKSGINSNKVIFTGKLDNDTLMIYMSASDVTFALYSNVSLNNRMCSPNKVFDALHSQTYVITTKSFLTTDIVSKNNIGEILHSINPNSILSALEECYNKRNNQINNERWGALQLKYCWESEFERVKQYII